MEWDGMGHYMWQLGGLCSAIRCAVVRRPLQIESFFIPHWIIGNVQRRGRMQRGLNVSQFHGHNWVTESVL